jgi:hypothetical protein
MARKPLPLPSPTRRMRGFEPASGFVKDPVRAVGESRGFAVARLLTHWAEIVGEDLARTTRPVKVGYGREGMGATLTVLTTASQAPMVQMALPRIKDRVNACYGYAAIARIMVTQTAPTGFAEGQVEFTPAPKAAKVVDPAIIQAAAETADGVQDTSLRAALENLARNVLSRRKA